ncbi:MAG: glyoxylate/hydroxypyruvate reductase A [Rhodospirillaceae bacterium]|jgi:glyoxylate/hydroxypyruvate reductase|nr:glyoxylate/hydroxypyruvate reductase A [Rhodospirillaceae bacterium]MBT4218359.1 glyoxylate/hydroxypyruvate reductase A [Rhodospirillaceae bacterium]MBT4463501.1 glyoxylate/hydroxypyruvate reductase A [Rhodospirillaceae bacterium]MBT5013223.1 glyoxylate/hydroxypyruvate reductase A [Rhodospirillaceae bacterium]MBT5308579.1 glyoxylate/hydroxypyruvate reductase A [Rhodospirillaceae bacterium]
MGIIFIAGEIDADVWRDVLAAELPEIDFDTDFYVWPDRPTDPGDIDIALVWRPPENALSEFPGLACVINLGAGVDSILNDETYPRHVPLVRMIDPALTRHMTEFVIQRVLTFHRKFHVYDSFQRNHDWKEMRQEDTLTKRVGILGLGELGSDAARVLASIGFDVAGWSRREKTIDGVQSFFGEDAFTPFLGRTDILVCLLPLTEATRGILNADTLSQLPEGAYVINAARGGHQVEADLLAALDSGHLAGAALDVFNEEPLPASSPIWDHPKVLVTPHIASLSSPGSAAREIAANIRRIRKGEEPTDQVSLDAGY